MPELFTRVPMSGAGMRAETVELARVLGLRVALLAEHDDVDVPADLERLCARLARPPDEARAPEFTRHTRRALVELALLS